MTDSADLPHIPHIDLNPAWLARYREDILDPGLPIVDPHHHLWDRGGGYLLDELLADTGTGHNVKATVFVQCGYAYRQSGPEALPESLRRQVDGRKARHNFEHMHTLQTLKPMTDEERAAVPPVWQPLVRLHPVTRRKSLYISPIYNDGVEGMSPAAGIALIKELAEFAGQPRFVYRHRWEPDDVLMWDNRCTMHQVTAFDPRERRVMHRTTVVGDAPVIPA